VIPLYIDNTPLPNTPGNPPLSSHSSFGLLVGRRSLSVRSVIQPLLALGCSCSVQWSWPWPHKHRCFRRLSCSSPVKSVGVRLPLRTPLAFRPLFIGSSEQRFSLYSSAFEHGRSFSLYSSAPRVHSSRQSLAGRRSRF
jgi:hypothetical protein